MMRGRDLLLTGQIAEARERCAAARSRGEKVAFVPTMGALHEGHLRLVDEARARAGFVAVSIFVNPMQFGPAEDLARYPRTLASDEEKLAARGVDLVFAPQVEEMYPPGFDAKVSVGGPTAGLCGALRPGHFDGVTTVVVKLLHIVGPCVAVFGRKDYQQLQVVRKAVRDLFVPAEIVGVPTVREPDGLAMSSRNRYLSAAERERALCLSRGLLTAHSQFARGERNAGALRGMAATLVEVAADSVDYVAAADPDTLEMLPDSAAAGERLLIAIAARIGSTRLIDNTVLGEDLPPLSLR